MRAIGIKLNCNRRMCCVKSLTITLTLAIYVIVTKNYYLSTRFRLIDIEIADLDSDYYHNDNPIIIIIMTTTME